LVTNWSAPGNATADSGINESSTTKARSTRIRIPESQFPRYDQFHCGAAGWRSCQSQPALKSCGPLLHSLKSKMSFSPAGRHIRVNALAVIADSQNEVLRIA